MSWVEKEKAAFLLEKSIQRDLWWHQGRNDWQASVRCRPCPRPWVRLGTQDNGGGPVCLMRATTENRCLQCSVMRILKIQKVTCRSSSELPATVSKPRSDKGTNTGDPCEAYAQPQRNE